MRLIVPIPRATQSQTSPPVTKRTTGAAMIAKQPTASRIHDVILDARTLSICRISSLLPGEPSLLVFTIYNERAQAFVYASRPKRTKRGKNDKS